MCSIRTLKHQPVFMADLVRTCGGGNPSGAMAVVARWVIWVEADGQHTVAWVDIAATGQPGPRREDGPLTSLTAAAAVVTKQIGVG